MSSSDNQIEKTKEGVVVIDYNDLVKEDGSLHDSIEEAYGTGDTCLGILVVKNIPGYTDLRTKLLPIAEQFGSLPEETKEKYVHEPSGYSVGWSHGKEFLKKNKPDVAKGSYYANPQIDDPSEGEDEKVVKENPEIMHPNIWPTEDCPDMEDAFKAMGQKMCDVGFLLAKLLDTFVEEKCDNYTKGRIHDTISKSKSTKGRLLHYFPVEYKEEEEVESDGWCGKHFDHSSLTSLTRAMFTKDGKEVPNPDPENSGLFIQARSGDIVRAVIPEDMLAFQIGESAEIHSGGRLRATLHWVKAPSGPKASGVARNTFPVFMEPNFDDDMNLPEGDDAEEFVCGQWQPGMSFADFSAATIKHYYDNMGD